MLSRMFNLFGDNQQPNPVEGEALLDLDGNPVEVDDEEFDVVVDAAPAVKILPPTLQDQIEEYLDLIDEVAVDVPQHHASLTKKMRIYSALAIGVTLTAIVSPGLLFRYFYYDIFPDVSEFVAECNQTIADLKQKLIALQRISDDYHSEMIAARDRINDVLMPVIHRWEAYDETDSNCMIEHDVEHLYEKHPLDSVSPGLFCYEKNKMIDGHGWSWKADCVEIAKDGCMLELKHQDLVKEQRDTEMNDVHWRSVVSYTQSEIERYEYRRDHASEIESSFFAKALTIVGGVTGLIVLAGVALLYRIRYKEYHQEIKPFYRFNRAMHDISISPDSLVLLGKLGVQLTDDMSVGDLKRELQVKSAEIDYRWKQRTAFLGGAKREGTALYSFFHNRGHHDVVRIILDKANLGPVVRPE